MEKMIGGEIMEVLKPGGALRGLDLKDGQFARRKADQTSELGFMTTRIGIVEAKVREGKITANQGGVLMRLIADRVVSLHREHLPAQIPIAPTWRLNTDTVSLERPWKQHPDIPEPYNTWWTHHKVIASALHHQTRNAVL